MLGGLGLRRMAGSNGEKSNKSSRGTYGGKNALRAGQRPVYVDGNQPCRWFTGRRFAETRITEIDLSPASRSFRQIRSGRAKSHEAAVGTHRGRATVVVGGSAVIGRREEHGALLATRLSALASVVEKYLGVFTLGRGERDVPAIEAYCRRFFRDSNLCGSGTGRSCSGFDGRTNACDCEGESIARTASAGRRIGHGRIADSHRCRDWIGDESSTHGGLDLGCADGADDGKSRLR